MIAVLFATRVVQVAILGPVPANLPAALGTGYQLLPVANVAELARVRPSVVVVFARALAPGINRFDSAQLDRFVPTVRTRLRELKALSFHPRIVFLAPSALTTESRDHVDTFLNPLIRQAAREAGVAVTEVGADVVSDVTDAIVDPSLAKAGWRLVSTDSEQIDEGPASAAIDGNPDTYWHTMYDPSQPRPPHQIVVDMGSATKIRGFRYVPRQDGGVNGRVAKYEFYVSLDGKTWGTPIVTGTLPPSSEPTRVRFAQVTDARYFKFVALSETNGGPWSSAAEIDVLRAAP